MLETFKALAEPNRLQIVNLLFREALPVGVVAERLGIRQPQASKHLQALSACGLVEVSRDAHRRIYALRPQPFREMDDWLQRYRSLWEEQFGRLDVVLADLQSARKSGKEKPARVRPAKKPVR